MLNISRWFAFRTHRAWAWKCGDSIFSGRGWRVGAAQDHLLPTGPVSLSHNHPDCTGYWSVRTRAGSGYSECDLCGAIRYASDANRSAAIQENLAGSTLERLTKEGRKLLEGA